MKWFRTNRQNRCRICDKPDWCTFTDDGTVCCMRVESSKALKNGGWLHRTDAPAQPIRSAPVVFTPQIDAVEILRTFDHDPGRIANLAHSIGVTVASLIALGCAWAQPHRAWAFPMCDSRGHPVGIRLRADNGQKWAVTGSRQGIFVPHVPAGQTAFICEGPTDTAAALSIGCYALGRPSCSAGLDEITTTLANKGVRRMVVVSDNDSPGIRGAEKLSMMVPIPSCIFVPPAKDMRAFVQNGGTLALIDCCLKNVVWTVKGNEQ